MQCKNYRRITLMNVAYKNFATVLSNKLSEIMKVNWENTKQGFGQIDQQQTTYLYYAKRMRNVMSTTLNCTTPL